MKFKMLALAVALAAVGVSTAIAAPPPGKGKPPSSGAGCRPQVSVVLKGTLVGPPGAAGTSFTMNVTSANRHGQAYLGPPQPVTILIIAAKTKVRRQGKKSLADLAAGDRLLVQARACKADLANTARAPLTAVRIVAHPAQNDTA